MLETKIKNSYSRNDDGAADIEEKDINENGETTDKISMASAVVTITSAVSSHQDVQTQVQTVNDNFTVGKGTSPYNEECWMNTKSSAKSSACWSSGKGSMQICVAVWRLQSGHTKGGRRNRLKRN